MKRQLWWKALGVSAVSTVALGLATFGPTTAAFASASTFSAAGLTFDLGPSPVGLPASCPFSNGDANFVFISGNAVGYGTMNKNGDWGGGNAEGTAVFQEGTTPLYQGHLHIWFGGGNNIQGQNENGFTLAFKGSGVSDTSQALTLHVSTGSATPAHGTTPTSNRLNVSIACS
jgi:hypothetical protein